MAVHLSLKKFLNIVIITTLSIFFIIVYSLIAMQNTTIINASSSQLHGEISKNIQEQLTNYMQNASQKLNVVHDLLSNKNVFGKTLNEETLFSLLDDLLKQDPNINALYFATNTGSFYMSKRIAKKYISRRRVIHNNDTIVSQWTHPSNNIRLEDNYPVYNVSTVDKGYDARKRPWYQNAEKSENDVIEWTNPYIFFTDNLFGMTGTKKITTESFSGVIAVDISLSYIRDFLDSLLVTSLGSVLIVDDENSVIALSDHENKAYTTTYTEHVTNNQQTIEKRVLKINDIDSSPEMIHFIKNIVTIPENELIISSKLKQNLLEILMSTVFVKYSQSASLKSLFISNLNLLIGSFKNNKTNYLYTYNKLKPANKLSWRVYTSINKKIFTSNSDFITLLILWTFLGFIIIMMIVTVQSIKVITVPLTVIAKLMTSLKQLKLDSQYDNKSNIRITEIQNIGEIYNNIVISMFSFKKFVPMTIVKKSIASPDVVLLPMMEKKENISILFSDIKDFTTITENVSPETLCEGLGYYFSTLSTLIEKNNGTLDKFIGDAIMALFGNFEKTSYSAVDALYTAISMKKEITKINTLLQERYKNPILNFDTKIGVSTGEAMVGILGSDVRLNYTAIGDIVNLASRLENLNKEYSTRIITSSTTVQQSEGLFVFRYLDSVQVKGKNKFIDAYQVLGTKKEVSPETQDYIKHYEIAYKLYLNKEFNSARSKIKEIESHKTKVQDIFLTKLKQKMDNLQLHK